VADAATAANAGDANDSADIFQRAPRETEALFLLGGWPTACQATSE
jgi:hypothetical protein